MSSKPEPSDYSSFIPMFLRLYWMFIGYVPAFLSLVKVARREGSAGLSQVLYFVFIFLVILVRFIDIKFYNGATAEGKPATIKTFFAFSAILLLVSVCIFVILFFL